VPAGDFFQKLGPYARISTAVAPLAIAAALRVLFGKNRLTGVLLTLATTWLVVCVLLAPFSGTMQQDLRRFFH
jgi:hypothetical protein